MERGKSLGEVRRIVRKRSRVPGDEHRIVSKIDRKVGRERARNNERAVLARRG